MNLGFVTSKCDYSYMILYRGMLIVLFYEWQIVLPVPSLLAWTRRFMNCSQWLNSSAQR